MAMNSYKMARDSQQSYENDRFNVELFIDSVHNSYYYYEQTHTYISLTHTQTHYHTSYPFWFYWISS